MTTRVWAEVLALIYPDERSTLLAAAERSAMLRLIGGAHFPSDLTGGRLVADQVIVELGRSSHLKAALASAGVEAAGLAGRRAVPLSPNALSHYLGSAGIKLAAFLPAPPVADLDAVRAAVGARSPQQIAATLRLERTDPWSFVQDALGVRASPNSLPKLAAFLDRVRDDLEPYIIAARNAHDVPRPIRRDPAITTLSPSPANSSYPSAKVWSFALQLDLLSEFFANARSRWLEDMQELGESRVIAGVHYPSDIVGAMEAARRMAAAIRTSEPFLRERDALKVEARAFSSTIDFRRP